MSLIRTGAGTTITITSGTATSAAIASDRTAMYGLIFPSALTSTTMTFTVCGTLAGTYVALYDETNTQVSVTVAASRAYSLPDSLSSWPFFKIVLGSNEGADRALTLCVKG